MTEKKKQDESIVYHEIAQLDRAIRLLSAVDLFRQPRTRKVLIDGKEIEVPNASQDFAFQEALRSLKYVTTRLKAKHDPAQQAVLEIIAQIREQAFWMHEERRDPELVPGLQAARIVMMNISRERDRRRGKLKANRTG